MVERIAGMGVDEFISLYNEKGPFELSDGEIITMSPPKLGHGNSAGNIYYAIRDLAQPRKIGRAFMEVPYVLTDDPNWVKGSRVPDVTFIRAERWEKYSSENPDWRKKPLILVPDLVVEIVSPTDRYVDVEKKVMQYLADGVQILWLVNPEHHTVTVYRASSNQPTRLTTNDALDGADIIPGFTISVASIFED